MYVFKLAEKFASRTRIALGLGLTKVGEVEHLANNFHHFPLFTQNSDFLAQKLTHLNRENFKDLSPVGLSNLVATFPGLDPMVARKIADHDIDGEAFLMLTQKVSLCREALKLSSYLGIIWTIWSAFLCFQI